MYLLSITKLLVIESSSLRSRVSSIFTQPLKSGINNNKQLYEYSKNGADAFLIGESLMKSEDIEIATKNLIKK